VNTPRFIISCIERIHIPSFRTDFLITTSVDGHLKLWKKQEQGIEFVKHYRAHLTTITAVSASADGQLFATVSEDMTAKVFDVVNFGKKKGHFGVISMNSKTIFTC
jgi:WD40 repeat protein